MIVKYYKNIDKLFIILYKKFIIRQVIQIKIYNTKKQKKIILKHYNNIDKLFINF